MKKNIHGNLIKLISSNRIKKFDGVLNTVFYNLEIVKSLYILKYIMYYLHIVGILYHNN
jgi:hypothetical protein